MTRSEFAALLQKYESVIYWKSGETFPDAVVHEWRLVDNDRLILKEIQHSGGSAYFYFPNK